MKKKCWFCDKVKPGMTLMNDREKREGRKRAEKKYACQVCIIKVRQTQPEWFSIRDQISGDPFKSVRKQQSQIKDLKKEVGEIKNNVEKIKTHPKLNEELMKNVIAKWRFFVVKKKYLRNQGWRFKLFGLSHREKIRIKYANKHTFQAVREEIKAQRSPDMILGGAVFFFLIFFGWDKFWTWYQKPLDDEWGWDDEEEEENVEDNKEDKALPVEETSPAPKKKTLWGWIKSNKVKMLSLTLAIILTIIFLVNLAKLFLGK